MTARPAGVLLTLAATLLALSGLELATREAFGVPLLANTNFVAEGIDIIHANSGVLVHDDLVGWRLADHKHVGEGFDTGAYGIRLNTGTVDLAPPTGAILAVGDSFTAGSGVRNQETWPAQLDALTGEPVVNASSGGWGGDQIVLNAWQIVPILKPKTLVVSFLADDSLRNAYSVYGGGQKPYFTIAEDLLELHNVPVPAPASHGASLDIWRTVFGHSLFVMKAAQATGRFPDWIGAGQFSYARAISNEEAVKVSCLLMDKLAAIRDSGVRVIFMVQYNGPAAMGSEPPWYGPPVLACARDRGLETIDTFQPLHQVSMTDRGQFSRFWIDEFGQMGHMTAEGNTFIARLVAARLSAD